MFIYNKTWKIQAVIAKSSMTALCPLKHVKVLRFVTFQNVLLRSLNEQTVKL